MVSIGGNQYGVIKGNLNNTSFESNVVAGGGMITYLVVTNKTVGAVTINIMIKDTNGVYVQVSPLNFSLVAGGRYTDANLIVDDREQIAIQTNGTNVDYYFAILYGSQ